LNNDSAKSLFHHLAHEIPGMKILPPDLRTHLEGGATTLCWCWKLERLDGLRLGFTDHDRPLVFDALVFEANTGLTASEIQDTTGLNVDNLELDGALTSGRLDEAGLASGLFDNAAIEVWRVNWADVSQRVLMRKGSLGEVRRTPSGFTAEARGLAHYLNQENGRLYQYACDAELGDRRCKFDLEGTPGAKGAGSATYARARWVFEADGLESFGSGHFNGGLLTWTTGGNCGQTIEIRRHEVTASAVAIELWRSMPRPIAAGDAFSVQTGCDKLFATCRDRYANAVNFRGFPHLPGNDFLIRTAVSGGGPYNGGALKG
jgi:uncharacterized phage protein (TIGR02218 family)